MKQRDQRHRTLLRTTQIAIASAAFALLAACGGGGGGSSASDTPPSGVKMQVVSFGTSLSDAGTYQPILLGFGGGRFTTNPGEVWTQKVSEYFGSTMTAAYQGGFGSVLQATGGLNYAQGGAWVTGLGVDTTDANPTTTPAPGPTEMPLTWQVQQYLSQHGSFNANQLVLVEGGANDILNNITPILLTVIGEMLNAQLTTGTPPTAAQVATWVQAATVPVLQSSAAALAGVVGQILQNGATHVALMNVPDIGVTPLAQAGGQIQAGISGPLTAQLSAPPYNLPAAEVAGIVAQVQAQIPALVSGIVQTYNGTVTAALGSAANDVIAVDSYAWLDKLIGNATTTGTYAAQGFTVGNTDTACDLKQMANDAIGFYTANPAAIPAGETAEAAGTAFASSLFCSPATLKAPNADQTYVFADTIHPATHTHEVFAQFVEQTLAAAGVGKAPQ